AADCIRDFHVTGVQTYALPILTAGAIASNFDSSRPLRCCISRSHSVRICRCLDTVGLEESKLEAIAPAVMDCEASSSRMARRVGSAMAWKTSLLSFTA